MVIFSVAKVVMYEAERHHFFAFIRLICFRICYMSFILGSSWLIL